MKVKAKLNFGIGLLFAMIVLLTLLSALFINKLSVDSKNILVANYNTLDYSRNMLSALNNNVTISGEKKLFTDNLMLQQNNITEPGEKELTEKLSADFNALQLKPNDSILEKTMRNDISGIMLLNMKAIQKKNSIAENTADTSIFWIGVAGAVCFLIAFVLLINLPGNIANPIKEFTESIKQIAAENYSQRIHFEKENEFGELARAFNTMAQKLQEYKAGNLEKLLIEKKRIETLINNMNDPVIGLDNNHRILFMNNIALKVAALKQENIIGQQVQNIAVQNDLIRSLIQDLFVEKNEEISSLPLKIYANNKESYFEKEIIPIKIVPTGESVEKLIGNVILLRNITPYKELDFAKTNFIATVSHELKTPIASIKMSLQLMENKQLGELNNEQKSLLESIKDDASRLLKITGELLNMTQVESGSIQLSTIETDVKEMIDYAVSANKSAAEQKHIKFEIHSPDAHLKVIADSEKTAWVITNILSNAVRFSPENSTINLNVSKENGKIKMSVTDTGQGIAPQYITKIFTRYFRIPGTKKEGTGLGLAISKEFIEAQNGEIKAESEIGVGSTFSVLLPAANA